VRSPRKAFQLSAGRASWAAGIAFRSDFVKMPKPMTKRTIKPLRVTAACPFETQPLPHVWFTAMVQPDA